MAELASRPNQLDVSGSTQQWALVLLLGTVFLSLFFEIIPLVRYLKYASLPLLTLLYIGSLKDVHHPVIFVKQYTLPFLILLLAYAVFLPRINFDGIKDMLFIACYLVFFTLFDDRKVNTTLLNVALIGVFAVLILWRGNTGSLSIIDSTAFAESLLSFMFGLFAVFALLKKRYFWFLINAVALILSLKRIALLGLLAVVAVMILPRPLRRAVTHPVVACVFNIFALGVLLALGSGALDSFFMDHYGFSIGGTAMGRSNYYAEASRQILANPVTIGLFGAGPGASLSTLSEFGDFYTLHSDVLKIFYELGAIWFIAFIFALYAVADLRLRVLALYMNVIFLTDNALIYVDVMVFYMILASQLSLPDTSGGDIQKIAQTGRG